VIGNLRATRGENLNIHGSHSGPKSPTGVRRPSAIASWPRTGPRPAARGPSSDSPPDRIDTHGRRIGALKGAVYIALTQAADLQTGACMLNIIRMAWGLGIAPRR